MSCDDDDDDDDDQMITNNELSDLDLQFLWSHNLKFTDYSKGHTGWIFRKVAYLTVPDFWQQQPMLASWSWLGPWQFLTNYVKLWKKNNDLSVYTKLPTISSVVILCNVGIFVWQVRSTQAAGWSRISPDRCRPTLSRNSSHLAESAWNRRGVWRLCMT